MLVGFFLLLDPVLYIVAGNWRQSIWIWDSHTRKLVANWKGYSGPVWCVEFTPDGEGLMGGGDKTLKRWDLRYDSGGRPQQWLEG